MGKNQKHKKKLKSEKSKVRITSKTKFLPKGQNVTNTSFKIRPIVIQEQLKEKEKNIALSKRKQSVPELITKLKHYNETIKVEACKDLSEMVKKYSLNALQNHLSVIIQHSSVLIQDRERKVRKACVKLVNEILLNIDSDKLRPFFSYISTNLRCAMTNIDRNVQEDSLLLLDSLLEHYPKLVAENSEKIFPDFLTLISKLRGDSRLGRTITVNLGSKLTSVKWRIKVLSRLYGILDAMIKYCVPDRAKFEFQKKSNTIQANNVSYIALNKNFEVYENFFNDATKSKNGLNVHIATLIPLLYETWLEVLPEKQLKKSSQNTILDEETAGILSCIVNILTLLLSYSKDNPELDDIFNSKETGKFLEYLLSNFPYSQSKKSTETDLYKLLRKIDDLKCVEENLLICYLFCLLRVNFSNPELTRDKSKLVSSYLNKCLTSEDYINSENVRYLVVILKEVLLENEKMWQKRGVDTFSIMGNLIRFYNDGIEEEWKGELLEILTTHTKFRSGIHEDWLKHLPILLCRPKVSSTLIDVILNLCKQNVALVQTGVMLHLQEILGNLSKMEILGTANQDGAKMKIAFICFYLPDLDLSLLRDFISANSGLSSCVHLKNMLMFK